jgi:hypothetical protein
MPTLGRNCGQSLERHRSASPAEARKKRHRSRDRGHPDAEQMRKAQQRTLVVDIGERVACRDDVLDTAQ